MAQCLTVIVRPTDEPKASIAGLCAVITRRVGKAVKNAWLPHGQALSIHRVDQTQKETLLEVISERGWMIIDMIVEDES